MRRFLFLLSLVAMMAAVAVAQTRHSAPPSSTTDDMPSAQAVKITNGPGAAKITDRSAEIFWNSAQRSGATVRYGTSPSMMTQSVADTSDGTDHKVEITGLRPNTTYYFQVESNLGPGTAPSKSGIGTFKTMPSGER